MGNIKIYSIEKMARLAPEEKKKLDRYWTLIYGPDYAEEMTSDLLGDKPQQEKKVRKDS